MQFSVKALFLVATLLAFSTTVQAAGSFLEDLKLLRQGEAEAALLKKFADAAASGDTELTLSFIWPVTRIEFGEENWRKYISTKLNSFFVNYKNIDSYEHISAFNMEQSNTPALAHFGYIRDTNDKRQPFEIVIVVNEGKSYIANIYVGTCRKNLHPICE